MTDSTETRGRAASAHPTTADRVRQAGVSVSAFVAILGALVGSGLLGGEPMSEAAGGVFSADATPVAPAGPAFSIWSVIYAGLVAYTVWQWLPAQAVARRHRRTGYGIALSMLLNAAWLFAVQAAVLWLTILVMVALLIALIVIFVRLLRDRPRSTLDAVITDGTIGLYLGWIVVATAANVAAVLAEWGLRESIGAPELWAAAILGVAGLVGIALALWNGGRLAPTAAIAWGLAWVAVARLTGELESTTAAIAAIVSAAAVVIATVIARVQAIRRNRD